MKILGISSNYHDASASLIVNGQVVASSAEERFSYEKHDPSFPVNSIDFCLQHAGLKINDIDLVVYHEDPITKFSRSLSSSFKKFPFSFLSFLRTAKEFLSVGFWIKYDISKHLNISPKKIIYIPHHMSHAAHAFLTSPFEEAAVMTIDAVGEWTTSIIFKASRKNNKIKIEPVHLIPFPHSLGLLYSTFTGFLGFKVNDSECSTMALAAFGNPIYVEQIQRIFKQNSDGTFFLDLSYFDFSSDKKLPLTKKFIDAFGEPRPINEPLNFHSFKENKDITLDQKRYADIAASIQTITEQAVLNYARKAKEMTGCDQLCYAGGVALNCVANAKLDASQIFKSVYIPPDPGDGGGAMGAALYAAAQFTAPKTNSSFSAYLGKEYSLEDHFLKMIEKINLKDIIKTAHFKERLQASENLYYSRFDSQEAMINYIAQKISIKKIVGWMQGRFENGPRALGNRSILCRPDCTETAERMSQKVKARASFRPYACTILHECAAEYFDNYKDSKLAKWMQTSLKIKADQFSKIKASSHVDLTTRAQILKTEDNPLFYKLVKAHQNITQIPALLNTSFNLSGLPIVSTPYDALMMFTKTDMDILVINDLVISKEPI